MLNTDQSYPDIHRPKITFNVENAVIRTESKYCFSKSKNIALFTKFNSCP